MRYVGATRVTRENSLIDRLINFNLLNLIATATLKPLKLYLVVIIITFIYLQFKLWNNSSSLFMVYKLQDQIKKQQIELEQLTIRNNSLLEKIQILKKYPEAIEEQARVELGMVLSSEKYYQVIEPIE